MGANSKIALVSLIIATRNVQMLYLWIKIEIRRVNRQKIYNSQSSTSKAKPSTSNIQLLPSTPFPMTTSISTKTTDSSNTGSEIRANSTT